MIVETGEIEKQILIVTSQMEAVAPMSAVIGTVLQQVPTVMQPQTAILAAESQPFDLLIVDTHNSTECLPLIREFKRKFIHIPAIAMVPYGDMNMVEQVLEFGADDYISQPIPLQRLKTTLRNALRMRALLKHSGHHAAVASISGPGQLAYMRAALLRSSGQLKTLREMEDEMIQFAIEACDGCITQAARSLGVGRSTLYRKMQEKMVSHRLNTKKDPVQISRENHTTRPTIVTSSAGES